MKGGLIVAQGRIKPKNPDMCMRMPSFKDSHGKIVLPDFSVCERWSSVKHALIINFSLLKPKIITNNIHIFSSVSSILFGLRNK